MARRNLRGLQILSLRQMENDEKVLGWFTGCAVISADMVLVADRSKEKLKFVNLGNFRIEKKRSVAKPFDITTVPENKFAVTFCNGEIHIYMLPGAIDIPNPIDTFSGVEPRECFGVACFQEHLYVVCKEIVKGRAINSVLKLNMKTKDSNRIPLVEAGTLYFKSPMYIAVSEDGNALYISDCDANLVARLTLEGQVTGVYTGELNNPRGLVVLKDGSLLVCSKGTHTLHHIRGDLEEGSIVADANHIRFPDSLCYDRDRAKIIVTANDKVKVFDIGNENVP